MNAHGFGQMCIYRKHPGRTVPITIQRTNDSGLRFVNEVDPTQPIGKLQDDVVIPVDECVVDVEAQGSFVG